MKTIRTTKGQWGGKRADGRPCVVRAESEWELVGTDEALRSHVADWYFVDGMVKHVARMAEGEGGDLDYRCACLLAELVGIDLKDG